MKKFQIFVLEKKYSNLPMLHYSYNFNTQIELPLNTSLILLKLTLNSLISKIWKKYIQTFL